MFVERTDSTIGSKYKKAVYRGYTDDTFTKQVSRLISRRVGWRAPCSAAFVPPPTRPRIAHPCPPAPLPTPTHPRQVPAPPSAGLLGPTLVVEVGQKLQIVFKNALSFPANLMLDGGLAVSE